MLHIILTILKIIGIVLSVLIGIILLVLAAVLFIPVRYRVNGEKEGETFFVRAEAFWFMHILRVKAVYPKPGRTTVKLLWFTLYDSLGEQKTKKKKSRKTRKTEQKEVQSEKIKESKEESIEKKQDLKEQTSLEHPEERKRLEEYRKQDVDDGEETGKIRGFIRIIIKKITGFFEKIKEILRKIKNAAKNIWYTIKRLCDRIVKIRDDISYYMEVFGEEETKQAFSLCRRELHRIWKNIRPARCRAELVIGTGEPDTTGYILAMHGILYPIIGNAIIIEPDFENQVLKGKLFLKGRITVFVLLYAVIKIYFDKNIRYFLKRFKREEV